MYIVLHDDIIIILGKVKRVVLLLFVVIGCGGWGGIKSKHFRNKVINYFIILSVLSIFLNMLLTVDHPHGWL